MSTFQVEIVTPTAVKFRGEAQYLVAQGVLGQMGILANHAAMLSMLDPGMLGYRDKDGKTVTYAAGGGFVQVAQNKAVCLVDFAELPSEIDVAAARKQAEDVEKQLRKLHDGSVDRDQLREELKVAQARLLVAATRT